MTFVANLVRRARLSDAARRYAVDSLVAIIVAGAQAGFCYILSVHNNTGPITTGGYVLLVGSGLLLIWRRRFPVAVLIATNLTTLGYIATGNSSGPIWDAVVISFGTAIYLGKRGVAIAALAACYVAYLWGPAVVGTQPWPSATFALALALGLLVLLGGAEGIRLQHERNEAARRRLEELALRRATEERIRIARDLHDVLGHTISAINVQANTALHLMERQPERARDALATIHEVSRQALVELRSVLGVLRDAEDRAPFAPTPTLARLGELAATARAAGLDVRLESSDLDGMLPEAVDVAAYRIIQEGLTNAARHARGASAVVRVAVEERDLVVEVSDDGGHLGVGGHPGVGGYLGVGWHPAARAGTRSESNLAATGGAGSEPGATTGGAGSGKGIVGMRERAQSLGGTLEAAALPGRGFRVRARLPLGGRR